MIKILEILKSQIYDLGGGEYPLEDGKNNSVTTIDIISEKEYRKNGYKNPYIQANLNGYIKLDPVKEIFTNQMVKYLNRYDNLAKTINNALLPGGQIHIHENYANGWKSNFELVNLLIKNYKFKVKKGENVNKLAKEFNIKDPKNPTDEEIERIDDEGRGEISFTLQK